MQDQHPTQIHVKLKVQRLGNENATLPYPRRIRTPLSAPGVKHLVPPLTVSGPVRGRLSPLNPARPASFGKHQMPNLVGPLGPTCNDGL